MSKVDLNIFGRRVSVKGTRLFHDRLHLGVEEDDQVNEFFFLVSTNTSVGFCWLRGFTDRSVVMEYPVVKWGDRWVRKVPLARLQPINGRGRAQR